MVARAVFAPDLVVTVMIAVPALTPVTTPFASTLAKAVFDDVRVIDLSVALLGLTVAEGRTVPPTTTLPD
jgi:hypothetical protein